MLEALVVLVVGFGLFVVLPLMLLKVLLGFVGWLVMVPFKLLGAFFKVGVTGAIQLSARRSITCQSSRRVRNWRIPSTRVHQLSSRG